jgi:thymidylate synthase (FAD)
MKCKLISNLGNDLTVVNSARVSFDKHSDRINAKDKKLIKYLAKHKHFTPFTHCVITLLEEVPIFVARQRFKHTVGFSYNEVSRRYVDSDPVFFHPDEWRKRAENKKQGSEDFAIPSQQLTNKQYDEFLFKAFARAYKLRIDEHAQKEIQYLAKMWNDVIEPLYPTSWTALIGENNA